MAKVDQKLPKSPIFSSKEQSYNKKEEEDTTKKKTTTTRSKITPARSKQKQLANVCQQQAKSRQEAEQTVFIFYQIAKWTYEEFYRKNKLSWFFHDQ